MVKHYFNEFDPKAAAWLRELIRAGLLPDGDVDERSITEVRADDLRGYRGVHLFAGVGGWPLALRLAGWPEDREVWTGSCPCPPFSSAGKKKCCPECSGKRPVPCPRRTGYFICCDCEYAWHADARHLWPEFWRLVRDCRPPVVFGEQVASADGRVWLSGVRGSLEVLGYAVGSADLCAGGAGAEAEGRVRRGDSVSRERIVVGAPHIRQRLFWVADAQRAERRTPFGTGRDDDHGADARREEAAGGPGVRCRARGVGDTRSERTQGDERRPGPGEESQPASDAITRRLGNADRERRQERTGDGGVPRETGQADAGEVAGSTGAASDFWGAYDLIPCRDGKARRVEPGTFPLAHGLPGRVGLLRGYGNAIVPQVAAEFVAAFLEVEAEG